MNSLKYIVLFCLSAFLISPSFAQKKAIEQIINKDSLTKPFKKSVVIKATRLKDGKIKAGLGDYLKVQVTNMENFMQVYNDKHQKLVLYFNEVPMHGLNPTFISTHDSSIVFHLVRDTVSLSSWNVFYHGQTYYKSHQKVSVSLGFENDGSLDTKVKDFSLELVRTDLLVFTYLVIILMLILFILLVKKTGIIRDDNTNEHKGTYSLSRAQLAFWTFIIVFSFLYVYAVTGEITPITSSTLVLLTVSMTTTAGAKVIDSSKNPEHVDKNAKSEEFFKDIISDQNGVSIHRFQMVVWTLILGAFFLRSVMINLAMPQIDDSMLILMGISSGTYLGLKIPEKSTPEKVETPKETLPPPPAPEQEKQPCAEALPPDMPEDELYYDTPAVG
ncbi:MAG TPA: hypothetical protein VNB90_12840 [Cytophagaceae bacterium]|nr:hypothetical protein [Cytophagaceae bacterium]